MILKKKIRLNLDEIQAKRIKFCSQIAAVNVDNRILLNVCSWKIKYISFI